jgi:signal transduction histidine kinase
MRGYAEVILKDHGWRLDAEARELLTRIARSGSRMDRLMQDLLTYSQISRRELTLESVSVDKLVREVLQLYPEMRPEKADIEVEGPLPDVIAHEPSLTQVISNLLSNAVKFVPSKGRPRVRVRADLTDSRARIWIADNGIGIKPEHQARLFGLFERIHSASVYEGTGIGLAIVRKAIERMNGTVGVESDGISGSRFWIDLPMAQNGNGSGPDGRQELP